MKSLIYILICFLFILSFNYVSAAGTVTANLVLDTTNAGVNSSYVFTKNHENKKEVLEDAYLLKFMKSSLDFNKIIS